MSGLKQSLMIAIVLIARVPLAAQETRPAAATADQNIRLLGDRLKLSDLLVDRSLSTVLTQPADDPRSRLSGSFTMHIDLIDTRAAAGAPSTQPAQMQGNWTLSFHPTAIDTPAGQGWTVTSTQPTNAIIDSVDNRVLEALHTYRYDSNAIQFLLLANAGERNTGYLGIGVEAPGDALRSQLSLPDGAGLVVNYVDDSGPSKNTVHLHDVLQKLDDQILVNGEQFATLVRMHKPGDEITLTLLRQASSRTERITLGQRQPETKEPQSETDAQGLIDRSVREQLKTEVQGLTDRSVRAYYDTLYQAADAHPITFNDGEVLASLNGHGDLLVIDQKTGKTLFNGPIGSKEQWEQAPEAVRNKLNAWRAMIAAYQPAEKH